MKIIKEIEKSRLTEDGMQVITGGATNPGDQCSEEVTYRSCGSIGNIHFNVVPYWFGTHFLKIAFMNKIDSKLSKRILLVAIICFSIVNISFAQTQIHVDERFELTSIVFRLTDDIAFVHSTPANYIADIDDYFSPYKNHELIEFVKKTIYSKSSLNIAFPAFLASDIKITPKGIVWTDEWVATIHADDTSEENYRWTKTELQEYLKLLNKFYKDTRFREFYDAHAAYYQEIEASFSRIEDKIDTAWFRAFFGSPYSMDNIWLVPTNGNDNFAINRIDQRGMEHHNCVISCVDIDSSGKPYIDDDIFSVLIHESCHNYCNPILRKHQTSFKNVCDTLFEYVKNELSKCYYGTPMAILYEGINRACEYSYYIEHHTFNDSVLMHKLIGEIKIGFLWMEELVNYMTLFRCNKEEYPYFEDFVPTLEIFLKQCVELMDMYYLPKYHLLHPRVVATNPISGAVVDTNLHRIVIQFSKPMQKISSIGIIPEDDILQLPIDKDNIHWATPYTYVMPLREPLKSDSKYGYRVKTWFSDATYHFKMQNYYDLIFETK